MFGDPKKTVSIILGMDKAPEKELEDDIYETEMMNLAKDFIKAIEKKDALALKVIMKSFIMACDMAEDKGEDYKEEMGD